MRFIGERILHQLVRITSCLQTNQLTQSTIGLSETVNMKGWEQHILKSQVVTRLSRAEQLLWDVQQVSSSRGPEEQEGRTVTCNGMSGSRDCESCWLATNVRNRCASFHATLSSHRVSSNEGGLDTSSLTSSDFYYSLHSCILVTRPSRFGSRPIELNKHINDICTLT